MDAKQALSMSSTAKRSAELSIGQVRRKYIRKGFLTWFQPTLYNLGNTNDPVFMTLVPVPKKRYLLQSIHLKRDRQMNHINAKIDVLKIQGEPNRINETYYSITRHSHQPQ
jgi:hypothetical protein